MKRTTPYIVWYSRTDSSPSGAPGLEAWEQISWTGEVTAGFSTTFTCSSSCHPNCIYTWSFEGHTVIGSTLTWTPDGLDKTVELKCNVLNPETGVSSSMTSIVEIKSKYSRFITVSGVQWWKIIAYIYSSSVLFVLNNFEVFVLYFHVSIKCYFILLLHYISEWNIVLSSRLYFFFFIIFWAF